MSEKSDRFQQILNHPYREGDVLCERIFNVYVRSGALREMRLRVDFVQEDNAKFGRRERIR